MKNLRNLSGLQPLSTQEQVMINGGESFLYYVGYGAGRLLRFIEGSLDNTPNIT